MSLFCSLSFTFVVDYRCCLFILYFVFFFFKQKTAYEMRISDWSSDVCSSDLVNKAKRVVLLRHGRLGRCTFLYLVHSLPISPPCGDRSLLRTAQRVVCIGFVAPKTGTKKAPALIQDRQSVV